MSTSGKIKYPCNGCHRETVHDILFEKKDRGTEEFDEGFSIDFGLTLQVVQCRGCESFSMVRSSWNSEETDERGRPEITTAYFPPRTFREFPAALKSDFINQVCPPEIENLLNELYVALQNDSRASATMLMRAVFEHMMIEKVGDEGTFTDNLRRFEGEGYIGKKQREVVESMLEAGHASIHRAFIPKKEDVVALTDILESVLQVVYVQSSKAAEIKKRIPERKSRGKAHISSAKSV